MEDYEFIDIGPQTLAEHGRFDILSLTDIPIKKVYFYRIANLNRMIDFGYKMVLPKDTHIPSGEIVIYSFDTQDRKLGIYLGRSTIKEQFQQDEMDIKLGTTNLVRVECTVNEVEDIEHIHGGEGEIREKEGKEESAGLDPEVADFILQQLGPTGFQRFLGNTPSLSGLSKPSIADISVLLKRDVPKIKRTTIECVFTNNSTKNSALVVASYPVPYREKILSMTCKPSRVKSGMMEFNLVIKPSKSLVFRCEIVTHLSVSV